MVVAAVDGRLIALIPSGYSRAVVAVNFEGGELDYPLPYSFGDWPGDVVKPFGMAEVRCVPEFAIRIVVLRFGCC